MPGQPAKSAANGFGIASLVCSLSFWVLLGLSYIPGFPKSLDLSFNYWVAIWFAAIILALIAAARGNRRWAWAALLPLATFFFLIIFVNLREPT